MHSIITILGPTACGKTQLAVQIANQLNGEIISADSRQVFRGMDIGTGKDLSEYNCNGKPIPYHLIDILEPGYEYNVFEFQTNFIKAYSTITQKEKLPILCGGTGLYIESILQQYKMSSVPQNSILRNELQQFTTEELTNRLSQYIKLHNHTDTETRDRLIRAIEIQEYQAHHTKSYIKIPDFNSITIGIQYPREIVMDRIRNRLTYRLENGMIDEVVRLLNQNVLPERLIRYGLEYKYITLYIQGMLTYSQMFEELNIAIRQFAKRQMTWFRRMERNGMNIHWINGILPLEEKVNLVLDLYSKHPFSH